MILGETEIAKAVREAVNASRLAYVFRVQSGTRSGGRFRMAEAGTPDAIGYIRDGSGRMVAIEVKTSSGKLSLTQEEWMANAQAAGVLCIVARSPEDAIVSLLADRNERMKAGER